MDAQSFVEALSQVYLDDVFNPYRDICGDHDHPESPAIRRFNLERYLNVVAKNDLEAIWLGRDCGYRGGRRTGIALTDEVHLSLLDHRLGLGGLAKATIGQPVKERTATEVWKVICEVDAKVFLWNVFPFHPYENGNSMSNRRHSKREFNYCKDLLIVLLEWLQPKRIIALGADSYNAMQKLGFETSQVRHPSYGGHIEFAETIRDLYGYEGDTQ